MTYRRIDAAAVATTAELLKLRIDERLPGRGLVRVAQEVAEVAEEAVTEAPKLHNPVWWLRGLIAVLSVLLISAVLWAVLGLFSLPEGEVGRIEVLGVAEAVMNEVVLLGAGLIFLVRTEQRFKREHVLSRLSDLRSLAHVVDMHQLTKDPDRVLGLLSRTQSSPKNEDLDLEMLNRYLDYCSELLAIIGKVAAVYAQEAEDDTVLEVVGEVEGVCAGISRTIWQKIAIVRLIQAPK